MPFPHFVQHCIVEDVLCECLCHSCDPVPYDISGMLCPYPVLCLHSLGSFTNMWWISPLSVQWLQSAIELATVCTQPWSLLGLCTLYCKQPTVDLIRVVTVGSQPWSMLDLLILCSQPFLQVLTGPFLAELGIPASCASSVLIIVLRLCACV